MFYFLLTCKDFKVLNFYIIISFTGVMTEDGYPALTDELKTHGVQKDNLTIKNYYFKRHKLSSEASVYI